MHPIATNARLAFGVYRLCLSGTHRLAFARALERWLQVSLFSPDPQLEVALSSATLAYYRQGLALALAEAAPAAPPGPSPEDSD